jgi:hypothetical protein
LAESPRGVRLPQRRVSTISSVNMHDTLLYQRLADAVLFVHFGVVVFIVGGLLLVVIGNSLRWAWVNAFWLRFSHLMAIGVVAAEAWIGQACPLTRLESSLRAKAGVAPYVDTFIAHWTRQLLFYDAPLWMFTVLYTAFGLLVVIAWLKIPPTRRNSRRDDTRLDGANRPR